MEHAVTEIRHLDRLFDFADQEYEVDWIPRDCNIKLFSRGVTAKSRLALTREEAIKVFWHLFRQTSVRRLSHGHLLNHCSREQLKRKYK